MSDLTANKTFYVRTDGLDTNNGLTSGNAFLTLQRAVATVPTSLTSFDF